MLVTFEEKQFVLTAQFLNFLFKFAGAAQLVCLTGC